MIGIGLTLVLASHVISPARPAPVAAARLQLAQGFRAEPVAPPPPPREERVEPRRGWVWVQGNYEMRDGRYFWVGGHWERERPGWRWQPGRWEMRGRRYFWVPGAWVAAAPPPVQAAPPPPPPPQVEVAPAPRPGWYWVPGAHEWRDGRYVWIPGHWEHERRGHAWRQGHWEWQGGRQVWVPGGWR
jgi:hypothetical protein